MTAFPIETSDVIRNAAKIAQGIGNGVQMLQNPLEGSFTPANSVISNIDAQLTALINSTTVQTEIDTLTNIQNQLTDLRSSVNGLSTHTNSLVFGDNLGNLTSSGLTGNLGMATSAINLNDTFETLGDSSFVGNCDLIQDFFGSILGAGAALMSQIQSTVDGLLAIVSGGIAAIIGAATSIITNIQNLANQAISLVANEVAKFAEWIGKQLDFALGSFLASLDNISDCAGLVGDVVKTDNLTNIIG